MRNLLNQFYKFLLNNKSVAIVFGVALGLRWILGCFWILDEGTPALLGDDGQYFQLAKNLLLGNGFSMSVLPPYILDAFRTPGYPIFLIIASLGTLNASIIIFFQGIIAAITALLIFRIGKIMLDERAGFIAAMLYIVEPLAIFLTFQILPETIFTLLLLLSLYPLLTKRYRLTNWIIAGVAAGFAVLMKPIMLYLLPALFFIILIFGRKEKIIIKFFLAILICVAIMAPWMIRNKQQFGGYQLSWQGITILNKNINLYLRSMKNMTASEVEILRLKYYAEDKILPQDAILNMNYANFKYSGLFMKQWMAIIFRDPIGFFTYNTIASIPFFLGDGYVSIMSAIWPDFKINLFVWNGELSKLPLAFLRLSPLTAMIFIIGKLFWLVIYWYALRGLIRLFRGQAQRLIALFIFFIICYFALLPGPINHSRYRQPINPLIFLSAAIFFSSAKKRKDSLMFDFKDDKSPGPKKLSIVIPAYNEKNTILQILSKIDALDFGEVAKEVVIVNDASTDGTGEILRGLDGKYKIFHQEKNQGKGAALRVGFREATGDWVVVQDADLEYDPNDIKKILQKIKEPGVSVVYGSRRMNKNYFSERKSGHCFALGGIFLSWLSNILYGTKITDESTCYKMFRADVLKNIDLKCERFEFCPEVTAKVAKKNIKIYEVPIEYFPRRIDEGKKINWKDGLQAIWILIKYRFRD